MKKKNTLILSMILVGGASFLNPVQGMKKIGEITSAVASAVANKYNKLAGKEDVTVGVDTYLDPESEEGIVMIKELEKKRKMIDKIEKKRSALEEKNELNSDEMIFDSAEKEPIEESKEEISIVANDGIVGNKLSDVFREISKEKKYQEDVDYHARRESRKNKNIKKINEYSSIDHISNNEYEEDRFNEMLQLKPRENSGILNKNRLKINENSQEDILNQIESYEKNSITDNKKNRNASSIEYNDPFSEYENDKDMKSTEK